MYTALLHVHSILRWAILILLLLAIFKSAGAGNKPFTDTHKKIGLFLMICFDIQLLIGLYQWITGGYGLQAIQSNGMANVMKDSTTRFFAVEHFLLMLIATVLVHIGKSYAKKNMPDDKKHRKTVLFYALALVLVLISIPWPFREIFAGRGWF